MSVKIMSAIFDSKTLGPTERLVMLSLADHADDQGRCYPSIARLRERTGLSERAVQANIKALTAAGYLAVNANAGPSGCNVYFVRPTPAADAPPQEMHPRRKCTTPPQEVRPTPAADAPKPSGTIIEPPEKAILPSAWEIFNAAAARQGWPQAKTMTPARKSALKARIAEAGGIDGWTAAIRRAEASDFLSGRTDKAFRLTFDFLTGQQNFTKLTEGNYDNRKKETPHLRPVYSDEEYQRREELYQRQLEKARAEYGN